MEQGACGGADDLGIQHVHAVVHEDYGVAAGRIGRTDHGAGVARVAHLPEGGNLRGPTVLASSTSSAPACMDSALPTAAMPWRPD